MSGYYTSNRTSMDLARNEVNRKPQVAPMREGAAIHRFCLAGNAMFTIVSKKTGERFTYKISRAENKFNKKEFVWFVNLLTGPDNSNSYNCIGRLVEHGEFNWDFVPTAKHRNSKSPSILGFRFFWDHLDRTLTLHERLEFFHAGRCGRCGRTLTVPESVESGFGPECAGRMD